MIFDGGLIYVATDDYLCAVEQEQLEDLTKNESRRFEEAYKRLRVANYLDLLEDHGPRLRAPHSEAMGDGLFELRPKSRSGIGRAFYCYCSGRVITILHAFVKKTQKTPKRELAIARQRLKEVKRHG